MKLSIYKGERGELSVLVEASLGTGKPPVALSGITEENFVARVLPVVEAQRREPTPGPA